MHTYSPFATTKWALKEVLLESVSLNISASWVLDTFHNFVGVNVIYGIPNCVHKIQNLKNLKKFFTQTQTSNPNNDKKNVHTQ